MQDRAAAVETALWMAVEALEERAELIRGVPTIDDAASDDLAAGAS